MRPDTAARTAHTIRWAVPLRAGERRELGALTFANMGPAALLVRPNYPVNGHVTEIEGQAYAPPYARLHVIRGGTLLHAYYFAHDQYTVFVVSDPLTTQLEDA